MKSFERSLVVQGLNKSAKEFHFIEDLILNKLKVMKSQIQLD